MGLTEDQALVANADNYTLACALPGSGKTHTLIELSKNLIRKNINNRLLLITFTSAAKEELEERLAQYLTKQEINRVIVSTFHSAAWRMLKPYTSKKLLIGSAQYLILDRAYRSAMKSQLISDDMNIMEFSELIDRLGRLIGKNKSERDERLIAIYHELMDKEGVIDFNSICNQTYLMLSRHQIPTWNATHILVDEFQDTDDIQYLWLQEHGNQNIKLIVVGDDDQSIYSWRGGKGYENMVKFQKEFNAQAYVLRDCFRCGRKILSKAEKLIRNNKERIDKPMNAVRDIDGNVELRAFGDKDNEMCALIDMVSADPYNWGVIGRNNFTLNEVEAYLKKYNIPYQRLGGQSLFDNPAVVIFLRTLSLISNRKNNDHLSAILGYLHLEQSDIELIHNAVKSSRVHFSMLPSHTLIDNRSLIKLHAISEEWTDCSDQTGKSVRLKKVLGLFTNARKKGEVKMMGVIADILVEMKGGLTENIQSLESKIGVIKKKQPKGEISNLILTTMHSSKGLQFKKVWITNVESNVCPSKDSITDGEIEEERRLFYVAMTRAMDYLLLSYRQNPSEFLAEVMPIELKEILENKKEVKRKSKSKS